MTDSGKEFRVGGWGHLIGDEGSGYDLGRMAAVAVMMAFDVRGRQTVLTELLLNHFKLVKAEDLIPFIYKNAKISLSALAPLVGQAANRGNEVAIEILDRGAESLIELVKTGLNQFDDVPNDLFSQVD